MTSEWTASIMSLLQKVKTSSSWWIGNSWVLWCGIACLLPVSHIGRQWHWEVWGRCYPSGRHRIKICHRLVKFWHWQGVMWWALGCIAFWFRVWWECEGKVGSVSWTRCAEIVWFLNISEHGEVYMLFVINSIYVFAEIPHARPICCNFVMGIENTLEIFSMFTTSIFNTKVINTEGGLDQTADMFP